MGDALQALVLSLALGAAAPTNGLVPPHQSGASQTREVWVAQAGPLWGCVPGWGCAPTGPYVAWSPPPPILGPPPLPPPPPRPPPPPQTRSFVLYFDFDAATLTSEARSVAHQAAVYATQWGSSNVTVIAHTDTAGAPSYNIPLSERRANAAAAELIADGVSQGALNIGWKGENEPAVATGEGVKEQLNRRAVITVRY